MPNYSEKDVTLLVRALKRRFKKPIDVIKMLGCDAALAESLIPSNNVGEADAEFRGKLERLLGECASLRDGDMKKIMSFLDQELPFDRRTADAEGVEDDDRRDEDDRKAADRRARGGDEEDDGEAEVRKFLASKGMPADAIDTAIELRRQAIERGADELPESAVRGHLRPATQAADSFVEMFSEADRIKVDLTAAELASLYRLAPGMKRVGQGTTRMRRPAASDTASFEAEFPEAARIRTGPGR